VSGLAEAIGITVRTMAPGHVEALAAAVEPAACFSPEVAHVAEGAVAHAEYRAGVRRVCAAWAQEPALPGTAVTLALRAGAGIAEATAREQQVEIVWTGPTTLRAPARRTDMVLGEVIAAARSRLIVVSFAAYRVPAVVTALGDACDRGVAVTLVLESADAGVLTHDAADAFASLRHRIEVMVWPLDQRAISGHGAASLHAKCAVADEHTALVTSANLTGAALSHNMELGLLVRGGGVPRRLALLWQGLAADGTLVTA